MSPRLPSLHGRPIAFGHRGAMADAPENTIPGFQLALELGATGLESDVWITGDGIAVLDHDGKVGTRLRRTPIARVIRAELPAHIPTLTELLETVEPTVPISLDIKDTLAFPAVIAAARSVRQSEQSLWLCHPDLQVLTGWRPETEARLINSVRLSSLPQGMERRSAELQQRAIDGINLHHSEWNGGRVALAHRFGLMALGWGANHERELAAIIDVGIDAVFSDHVDRMAAVVSEYYGAIDR